MTVAPQATWPHALQEIDLKPVRSRVQSLMPDEPAVSTVYFLCKNGESHYFCSKWHIFQSGDLFLFPKWSTSPKEVFNIPSSMCLISTGNAYDVRKSSFASFMSTNNQQIRRRYAQYWGQELQTRSCAPGVLSLHYTFWLCGLKFGGILQYLPDNALASLHYWNHLCWKAWLIPTVSFSEYRNNCADFKPEN